MKRGVQNDAFEGNNLVNVYSKLRRLDDAQQVFDEMTVRDTMDVYLLNDFEGV